MYGIVLMAAMAGGVEAPEFGRRGCSCSSCYCSCSSCYSYCSCSSWCSCSSCKGSRRHSRCHGCHGCHSSCHCSGYSYCHGCSGCHGYCHGGGYCSGYCSGYCTGGYCSGYCTGGYCTGGYCTGCYGGCAVPYAAPIMKAPEGGKVIEEKKIEKKQEGSVAAPARIIVNLPANAKLTVDGEMTTSTSATRVFESPTLPAGRLFTYTLKAEYNRDGRNVVVAKDVKITAGETVNVSLAEAAAVASR